MQVKNEDGSLANPEIPNKKALLLKCGEMIPKLASRAQRMKDAIEAQKTESQAASGSPAPKSGGGKTGKSKKKKGKR